jgi:hypothetical protein
MEPFLGIIGLISLAVAGELFLNKKYENAAYQTIDKKLFRYVAMFGSAILAVLALATCLMLLAT